MRFARRPRVPGPAGDRDRLLAAARAGDDAALAVLRADLDPPSLALLDALLVPGDGDAVAVLAAARTCGDRPELLEQVVRVLLDGGARSPALVAELLDLPVALVLAARERALAREGRPAGAPGCRGWVLVAGGETATPLEQAAATVHLRRCRRCAEARAAAVPAPLRAAVPGPRAAAGDALRR